MCTKKLCVNYIGETNDVAEVAGTSAHYADTSHKNTKSCSTFLDNALQITDLPTEVLAFAFRYCSYREVAEQLRLVCRRFCNVSTMVLNSGIATLGSKLDRAMRAVEFNMIHVRTEPDLLIMSRAFNALEIIKSQYRLLRAVTWRYVCNPFTGSVPLACFYAGLLLDEFLRLLRLAYTSPGTLGFNFHYRDHDGSDIGRLSDLSKRFMNHFEKHTEKNLNVHYSVSGSKIIDLLDCLIQSDDRVQPYELTTSDDTGECHIKAHYRMQRSWFTCLNTSRFDSGQTWREEQRFMYLRLRRLVASNNEYVLEEVHYEREFLLQNSTIFTSKSPAPSTYSGYGEYAGNFFYYGNMNESAFENKFQMNGNHANDVGSEDFDSDENEDDSTPKLDLPVMDLDIDIEMRCPLELAPIDYLEKCKIPDFESRYSRMMKSIGVPILSKLDVESKFELQMIIRCHVSLSNRLPSIFQWLINSSDFDRANISVIVSDDYCSIPISDVDNSFKIEVLNFTNSIDMI